MIFQYTKTQFIYLFFIGIVSSLLFVSCNGDDSESNKETSPIENNSDNSSLNGDNSNFSADALTLLSLVNEERSSRGLSPLVLNSALNDAATKHSIDMEITIGELDHTGSDGSSFSQRSEKSNYSGFSRAENIARGQTSPEQVHNSWMNSEGHRSNILLTDITEMGIGRSGNYWTQVFGRI